MKLILINKVGRKGVIKLPTKTFKLGYLLKKFPMSWIIRGKGNERYRR